MKNDDEQCILILEVIGIIPVIWFALLVAPYLSSGLMGILDGVPEAMNHLFLIQLCGDSVKTVLIFLLSYGMRIGIYLSTKKYYRRGEEYGSAKWGNVKKINRRYMEKSHCYNPFVYLKDDNDVQRLVTNRFKATTPKGSQSNDPFWDTAASMLLLALIRGVILKFSLCSDGVKWFESKGRFRDASYTPAAEDIIFFDWGNNGTIDHVGIVESVSGGTVNTIEGNSGDKVARRNYSIGSSNIYGYGVPAY